MLGMRESHEDWLALARDLIARGLGAPLLVVADGAPGLIKAVEQCWPASDRQHPGRSWRRHRSLRVGGRYRFVDGSEKVALSRRRCPGRGGPAGA
jgi:hypothetical protein